MADLAIRLFGGFDVRCGDQPARSFESQKARALLAYLACHRDRPIERETLATLLWSERSADSARRNLRQVLHSLRVALREDDGHGPFLRSDNRMVQLEPDRDCRIDVEAFEDAVERGFSPSGPDPHYLALAARLYVGDLLAGFFVKDSPVFEEWMVTEQERLREEAMEAMRALLAAYLARGEHRLGIRYARRLLALDPLSEKAQRQLMRLYALAGRRERALAHYEQFSNRMQSELGVEPLEETTELYRSILLQGSTGTPEDSGDDFIGPLVPLVGRNDAMGLLEEAWQRVLEGRGRMTVVEGGEGAGKSRLIKTFVDRATSRRRAVVVAGRAYASAPLVAFRPLAELLAGAFAELLPEESHVQSRLGGKTLADLAMIAPQLAEMGRELGIEAPTAQRADPARALESVHDFLEVLCRWTDPGDRTPVVLLLEDLQWADRATLDLLAGLRGRLREGPYWILATHSPDLGREGHPLFEPARSGFDRIAVGRLDPQAVEELAAALVGPDELPRLSGFLWQGSQGLPLAVAELINLLWDRGVLEPAESGVWSLTGDPAEAVRVPGSLDELIALRLRELPASARRLLAQAAIIGQHFDADVLRAAADEDLRVVEICIQMMLERWLIRQFPHSWSQVGREADLVLWARGARRGWFEFAHSAIREATLEQINPLRRRKMHAEVARAVRMDNAADPHRVSEILAHHFLAAGELDKALPWLESSVERAEARGAVDVAAEYRERAVQIIDRLLRDGEGGESLREARSRLAGSPGG